MAFSAQLSRAGVRASAGAARPLARKAVQTKAVLKALPKSKKGTSATKTAVVEKKPTPNAGFKLGFTKANELFVSRLAMLGFASSLIGEIVTGQGALGQFGYETGLTLDQVDEFVLALIAFNFIAAILPTSQTFVPEEQEVLAKSPKGPLQDPTISILQPKKFFGVTGFGFSKKNELFVGRMAQLGFAASLLGEAITGKGPLAQFGFETGLPVWEAEFGLVAFIAFFLFAAVNPGSGKFVDDEEVV